MVFETYTDYKMLDPDAARRHAGLPQREDSSVERSYARGIARPRATNLASSCTAHMTSSASVVGLLVPAMHSKYGNIRKKVQGCRCAEPRLAYCVPFVGTD
jgi:hypothetical protein